MQIYINRTVPLDDLLTVETLRGYTFTREQSGHVFDIGCTRGGSDIVLSGTCYAYFRRADNTTVHLNTEDVAQIDDMTGHAVVTLHPDCYNVPGRFQLSVYNATESGTVCIYCAVGMVQDTVSGTTLDVSGQSGYDTAVFARNVGAIEGELETVRAENAGIIQALAGANVMYLNTPNLLNPDAWWLNNGSANIVCGNAARWSKSGGAYMKSINNYIIYSTEPTAEQTAGSSYVYHREAYTDATTGTAYPEAWYVYIDNQDGITTSCVDLTGDAIITEQNGETFNKAIQYNITANSAWGNMETLYYPQGQNTAYYKQGETAKSYGYRIDEMEVGETYTVSCFARITSGDEAWLKFGWGGTLMNSMGFPPDKSGVSDVIKISGADWQRVSWSFVFNPTGAEYSESTASYTDPSGNTYNRVTREYNWQKRVMIGVHRKYTATLQLAGFRLTKGGLYGNNTVDTLAAEIADLKAQIAELQATVLENA